jgi:hypothetical protein
VRLGDRELRHLFRLAQISQFGAASSGQATNKNHGADRRIFRLRVDQAGPRGRRRMGPGSGLGGLPVPMSSLPVVIAARANLAPADSVESRHPSNEAGGLAEYSLRACDLWCCPPCKTETDKHRSGAYAHARGWNRTHMPSRQGSG